MASLANIRRLLGLSDHRQDVCDRGLDKARRSLVPLERDLYEIEHQIQGLNDLLQSHRAEDLRISHAQLLALLRRQAVIRRQIVNLTLDRVRVTSQHKGVVQELERLRETRKMMKKKHLKYQNLEQRLRGENRARMLRQEEIDIEELLVSAK
ncbi:hypothetical protein J1G36_25715 [Pseudomonas carnis]|uniref:hypothetical protein n=1 Tax=Pseudomonas TaxID=286 RepID=UPI000F57B801|nr:MULTISPECIES: hypothetical protein [Pseudomonas]AZC90116.1 Surface presentation of antigens protein SpaM [Pseudomonas chlororaphis subsp. piscium]MBY8955287.1 hypothetical protein [Pseudomonas carnis]